MFNIEVSVRLGALGVREGSAWAAISEEKGAYLIGHLKVILHVGKLGTLNVTQELDEAELIKIQERLVNRYIAAQARNEMTPEDWLRDQGA